MPTVLTERLKEKNFKLVDWMLEDVIRLFGLTTCLRDEDCDLNKKQILKALKKYDKEKIKERERELNPKYPPQLSERQLKKNYDKLIKRTNKELKESIEEREKIKQCIKELEKRAMSIIIADLTDMVTGLISTTREQLDIAEKENKWNIDFLKKLLKSNSTFEKYKKDIEEKRKREIKWLEEEKKEAQGQVAYSYAEEYQKLLDLFCK